MYCELIYSNISSWFSTKFFIFVDFLTNRFWFGETLPQNLWEDPLKEEEDHQIRVANMATVKALDTTHTIEKKIFQFYSLKL